MIRKLHRSEISVEKYQKCIEESIQNSDFVEIDFLDFVTDTNWILLVYNDYEAVMPVHFKEKWGVKIVLMPMFTTYFGIFSKIDSAKINQLFLKELRKIPLLYYAFNPENQFDEDLNQKVSYRISKNKYENIQTKYSKSRKRNVNISDSEKSKFQIEENSNPNSWYEFLRKNGKNSHSESGKQKHLQLACSLFDKGKCFSIGVHYNQIQQSYALSFKGKSTIYLSLFVNNEHLENKSIPSIVIDQILQKHCEEANFDFFGSSIPKVAEFNERFGADKYLYSVINQNIRKVFFNYVFRIFKF